MKQQRKKTTRRNLVQLPTQEEIELFNHFSMHSDYSLTAKVFKMEYAECAKRINKALQKISALCEILMMLGDRLDFEFLTKNSALFLRIDELGFSARVRNILTELDCITVKDILRLRKTKLVSRRGIGTQAVNEIEQRLRKYKLERLWI